MRSPAHSSLCMEGKPNWLRQPDAEYSRKLADCRTKTEKREIARACIRLVSVLCERFFPFTYPFGFSSSIFAKWRPRISRNQPTEWDTHTNTIHWILCRAQHFYRSQTVSRLKEWAQTLNALNTQHKARAAYVSRSERKRIVSTVTR